MFSETLATKLIVQARLMYQFAPLTDEEFIDGEDVYTPPEGDVEYTPEQAAIYDEWLAKAEAKRRAKANAKAEHIGPTLEELKAKAKAKVMAFYTDEAIANELSPFDD